jgi:hypothetical protein
MKWRTLAVCLAIGSLGSMGAAAGKAGRAAGHGKSEQNRYRVLAPIRHGNLTVFPVVASTSHDTGEFLTLDQGVRSGKVIVTEYGKLGMLIRRRGEPGPARPGAWRQPQSAEVNRLVLVNNSKRPLLLLAGEIVTGGKQDRVVGSDRIVPPESDPIDLGVFCVEPGRWVASSTKFTSMASAMAAPAVRGTAMGERNQQMVWSEVGKMQAGAIAGVAGGAGGELRSTTSYAQVMKNADVAERVNSIAGPIEESYRSLIGKLRDRKAVGVVVAVNGRIIWADVFASTDLLERYWPKLIRSYAAEAMVTQVSAGGAVDEKSAQAFLDDMAGRHEAVEIDPGLFRRKEITGDGFKVFELTSLLPKTDFVVHMAKMAVRGGYGVRYRPYGN